MDSSSPIRDGYASIADQPKPRPLSAVAQKAYDRYGVLDPVKLDLMIRGIFITREDAAALPSRITADGCPDLNSVHSSHYQRLPRSQAARGAAVAAGLSAASSARCIDISANPSDHEKWLEGEVEILIRMRAENVGFKFIAERFPSKNQKAVQEKFYKSTKDPRDPRWKRLLDDLLAQNNAAAENYTGPLKNPIETSDEDVIMNPVVNSSGTVSETTAVTEAGENKAEEVEDPMEDVKMTM